MASDLITYLVDEKVAEVERKYAEELEQKLAAMTRTVQEAVEDTIILRFPNTPAILVGTIRFITDAERLAVLRRAILQAPDQSAAEAHLAAIPAAA